MKKWILNPQNRYDLGFAVVFGGIFIGSGLVLSTCIQTSSWLDKRK